VILLDDFTARVDNETERRIFANIDKNYPDITKILITQKISSIRDADQIILLMEGELLASGTHEELIKTSFEYKQIAESQKTTE
jgi:ATP-binding cassette subfamily B protein